MKTSNPVTYTVALQGSEIGLGALIIVYLLFSPKVQSEASLHQVLSVRWNVGERKPRFQRHVLQRRLSVRRSLPHLHVNKADRGKDGREESPDGRLPPLAVDDVHQNRNPAERHEDGPALEAEHAPLRRKSQKMSHLATCHLSAWIRDILYASVDTMTHARTGRQAPASTHRVCGPVHFDNMGDSIVVQSEKREGKQNFTTATTLTFLTTLVSPSTHHHPSGRSGRLEL